MKNILFFVAGAVAGGVVAWNLAKSKYSKICLADVEDFKKAHTNKETTEKKKEPEKEQPVIKKKVKDQYEQVLKKTGYSKKSVTRPKNGAPYIISPDEFGEIDDYERVTLFHYADGVLTDDNDERVEDVAATVPEDYVLHFGEYEEDSVFVRNDEMKTDFEILRQFGKFGGGKS